MIHVTDKTSNMKKAFCRSGVIAMILAVLSIGSPRDADAESSRTVIAAADLVFPEGTIFVGRDLYFVDYARSDVLRLVGGRKEVIWHQDGCGANGLVAIPDGLLVACFDAGMVVKISLGGATQTTIRQDTAGQVFTAPNDLTADQKGDFYLQTQAPQTIQGRSSIFAAMV